MKKVDLRLYPRSTTSKRSLPYFFMTNYPAWQMKVLIQLCIIAQRKRTCLHMSFFIIALLIFGIAYGAYLPFHTSGMEWGKTLYQPTFALPCWSAGIVWAVIYLLMAIAVWRVWQKRKETYIDLALGIFAAQFFTNILWGPLVVNLQSINLAMLYVCLLPVLVALNIKAFWRVSKGASILLVPYMLWTIYLLFFEATIWLHHV